MAQSLIGALTRRGREQRRKSGEQYSGDAYEKRTLHRVINSSMPTHARVGMRI